MSFFLSPSFLRKRVIVAAVSSALTLVTGTTSHASALGFVETHDDGGVDGANNPDNTLFAPSGIALSPDGNHAYVAAAGDGAITVFSRDPASGRLTRQSALVQDGTTVDGLLAADEIIVSPDGKNVYAIGQKWNTVAMLTAYVRDSVTGELTSIQSLDALYLALLRVQLSSSQVSMAFSPDGRYLHVTARATQALIVFERAVDGTLALKEAFTTSGIGGRLIDAIRFPWDVALSPDGQNVYVVAAGETFMVNALTVLTRDPVNGNLTAVETHRSGVDGVEMMTNPKAVEVSPDGKYVYALSGDDGTIVTFARAADGTLTFVESHHHMDPTGTFNILLGAKSLTVSANGELVYVGAESTSTIAVMRRNTADGTLKLIGYEANGINNLALGKPQSVALSPDEKQFYVATSGAVNGVTVFDTTTDLSIVVQDDAEQAAPGANVNYTVIVTNGGASDATNVVVSGTLPEGSTFVSATTDAEGGVCELVDGTYSCSFPQVAATMAVSATAVLTMPAAAGTVSFEASVTADQIDADAANDKDVEETAVTASGGDGNDTAPAAPGDDATDGGIDAPANDVPAGGSSDGGGGATAPWWLFGLLGVAAVRASRRNTI